MGRFIISGLTVASMVWILYVGMNLVKSNDSISPATVFGPDDKSIVIIHKPLEIDFTQEPFSTISETIFFASMLTHTERVQHFYFSTSRKTALLERSKPWTIELVDRYFRSIDVSTTFTGTRTLELSNGWKARYDKEFLLVTKDDTKSREPNAVEWQYVDRRSSATIIEQPAKEALIENRYLHPGGSLNYISQSGGTGKHLVDDQDLFQDVIPARFDSYTFYEKSYLKLLSTESSPLFNWVDKGAAVIWAGERSCVITDQLPGQNPIAVLGDALTDAGISTDGKKAFAHDVPLPSVLSSSREWHIEVFNNRVFISSDPSMINDLIGNYELGNTLSQATEKRLMLFEKAPRNVSFRKIADGNHTTISLLTHSKHTVILDYEKNAEEQEEQPLEVPLRIDGGIAQVLPVQGTNFIFVLSNSNLLYGVVNGEEAWKTDLQAPAVGKLVLSRDHQSVLVATTGGVHFISRSGTSNNGFPSRQKELPVGSPVQYQWKGVDYIAYPSSGALIILNKNGGLNASIPAKGKLEKTDLIAWIRSGELMVSASGPEGISNYSVSKKRKKGGLQTSGLEFYPVKLQGEPTYFAVQNGQLKRFTSSGKVSVIDGNATRILSVQEDIGQTILLVLAGKSINVYNESGKLLGTIQPSFAGVEQGSVLTSGGGRTYISLLDGLSNNNYIYDLSGQQQANGSMEGAKTSVLHRQQNGTMFLVTQSNGYLVRYPLN